MTLHPVPKPKPRRKVLSTGPKAKGRSAFPRMRDDDFRRWVRQENPCLLAGRRLHLSVSPRDSRFAANDLPLRFWHVCWGPREAAHVGKTQAKGAPDFGAVVCLCRAAHRFYDEQRAKFFAATGYTERDMESAASGFGLKYVERGGEPVVTHTKHPNSR